jgi:uncharacterized protein YraI
MKCLNAVAGLVVGLAALPGFSQPQLAYAAKQVNLRAGPGMEYPVIAILLAGVPVTVQGCVADYHWCDVEAGPSRGWVYGANIAYPYQGANVPVISYGAMIGIGILAFSVGSYWDQHYVGRPWYGQRQRWINRPPPSALPHAPPVQRPVPMPPEHRGPVGHRSPPHVEPQETRPHGVPPVASPQREQAPTQRPQEPREAHKGPREKEQGPATR